MRRKREYIAVLLMTGMLLLSGCGTHTGGNESAVFITEPPEAAPAEVQPESEEPAQTEKQAAEPEEPAENTQPAKPENTAAPAETAQTETAGQTDAADEREAQPVEERESPEDAESEPVVQVIEITVPGKYFDDGCLEGEVTQNPDGSVTYRLSEEEHERLLREVREGIQRKLDEMCASRYFPNFDSITPNEDCTEFRVVCLSIETSMAEQESIPHIYDLGSRYAYYRGEKPGNIHIDYMTKLGNTFVTSNSMVTG